MTTQIWLLEGITPLAKPRMTQSDRWRKRKCVLDYWDYRDRIRSLVKLMGPEVTHLSVDFHLPMPHSWSKKKRQAKNRTWHDQKPDLDNLVKAVLDALFEEDARVACIQAKKHWSEQGSLLLSTDSLIEDSQESPMNPNQDTPAGACRVADTSATNSLSATLKPPKERVVACSGKIPPLGGGH